VLISIEDVMEAANIIIGFYVSKQMSQGKRRKTNKFSFSPKL